MIIRTSEYFPGAKPYDKYPGYKAPDGVNKIGYTFELNPDASSLLPLAKFLWNNLRGKYVGDQLRSPPGFETFCFNGKTQADMLRAENHPNAERIIQAYDLENEMCKIDWKYSMGDAFEKNWSSTKYLNDESEKMIRAGVVRVQIGENTFEVFNS